VVTYFQRKAKRGIGWQNLVMFAVLISVAPTARFAIAQESFHPVHSSTLPSINVPWWHSIYYKPNGMARYGYGFANSTRNFQWRVPVNPPLSGPSYGYFQPCWRQVPLVRRCVTCETFPSDREIPNPTTSQYSAPQPTLSVPPAPKSSSSPEATEKSDDTFEAPGDLSTPDATEAPKALDDAATDDLR